MRKIRMCLLAMLMASAAIAWIPAAGLAADFRHKVILQVSDDDPAKWSLTLNNARNIQHEVGSHNVDIEVVAYGPGLNMLKLGSPAMARVIAALAEGVKIVACENTMADTKVSKADMLPDIGYVKAATVELMMKQQQGWAYIRP
jgi:hypothetical protein